MKYMFSKLFIKVPKEVVVQMSNNYIFRMFEQTKKCPSYLLLIELLHYLKYTNILKLEFPYLNSQEQLKDNWMVMHLIILKNRFKYEQMTTSAISQRQIQTLNYNIQNYFFNLYAQNTNFHIPIRDFSKHFSEVYMRRLSLFEDIMKNYASVGTKNDCYKYAVVLRRIIYENKVKVDDVELIKLCKYYFAHEKYLAMLEWSLIIEWKVKWGFQQDMALIQNYQSNHK